MSLLEQLCLQTHTGDRAQALEYIRAAYPRFCQIEDTPESAGPFLDFVTRGIIIIRDPRNDAPDQRRIGYLKGPKWDEAELQAISDTVMALHNLTESGRRMAHQQAAVAEEERIGAAMAKRERRALKAKAHA